MEEEAIAGNSDCEVDLSELSDDSAAGHQADVFSCRAPCDDAGNNAGKKDKGLELHQEKSLAVRPAVT